MGLVMRELVTLCLALTGLAFSDPLDMTRAVHVDLEFNGKGVIKPTVHELNSFKQYALTERDCHLIGGWMAARRLMHVLELSTVESQLMLADSNMSDTLLQAFQKLDANAPTPPISKIIGHIAKARLPDAARSADLSRSVLVYVHVDELQVRLWEVWGSRCPRLFSAARSDPTVGCRCSRSSCPRGSPPTSPSKASVSARLCVERVAPCALPTGAAYTSPLSRVQREAIVHGFVLALFNASTPPYTGAALVFPLFTGTYLEDVQHLVQPSGTPVRLIPLPTLPLAASVRLLRDTNARKSVDAQFPDSLLPVVNDDKLPTTWTPAQLLVAQTCALLGHTPRLLINVLVPAIFQYRSSLDQSSSLSPAELELSTTRSEVAIRFRDAINTAASLDAADLAKNRASDLVRLFWSGVEVSDATIVQQAQLGLPVRLCVTRPRCRSFAGCAFCIS